ncbi:glycosyltransferase [Candidatus Leptofilum sp.]|uniref:glycosyltransferase n=1 Tax=Candidatus Leptofilum sp. TaxID=3241576 RepID=UPI003B5AF949
MSQQSASSTPSDLSVAVLVLNWNGRSLLETCLPTLLKQTYVNYKIVLVDNASTDESVGWVQANYPQVQIIQNEENLGFSRGINAGLRQISADVVVLLNNDVLVRPEWLVEMVRPFAQDPTVGIVGAKLLFPDGTIQHLGAELSYPLAHSHHFHYKEPDRNQIAAVRDVHYVTGASLAVRQDVLTQIGLLDEAFHPFYYEEVDFCTRARAAGFRVVVAPQAVATHDESATMAQVSGLKLQTLHQNRLRYVLKHYTLAQFLDDFVPAEAAYLAETPTPTQLAQLRLAYFATAVPQPLISPEAPVEQVTAVQNALLHLRRVAIQAKAEANQPPPNLTEFEFPESSTLLGTIAAGLRRTWSSIAAKWLVRSLMQQQNRQNQHLLRQIEQLHSQAQIQAQETDALLAELGKLRQRLDQIESQVKQQP